MKSINKYMEMIAAREPVVFDGALGTEIQKAEPRSEDYGDHAGCNEYLNVSRPDIIETIHTRYLEAGAHVIETNTFGGSRTKLDEFGLGDRVHEINKAAAAIARRAIDKVTGAGLAAAPSGADNRPRFVCGSIGPTGFLPSSSDKELSAVTFDGLVDIFEEQAAGLLDGGADILLIETTQDLLEMRAAIIGSRKAMESAGKKVPLQVQITMDASGKMLLGSDISAFLGAAEGLCVDVVGMNCSSGPDEMAPRIEELLSSSSIPVSMLPNAGLPCNEDGKAVYKMGAEEFAKKVSAFVIEKGVSVVGGCCGTTPAHIGALAEVLGNAECGPCLSRRSEAKPMRNAERVYLGDSQLKSKSKSKSKQIGDRGGDVDVDVHSAFRIPHSALNCWLSTGISGLDLERVKRPIIIGERLNAQGSKKTKELLVSHNYDELYHVAKEQVDRHSNLIDICVAANELDVSEAEMMGNVVAYLRDRISVPFCIDTTDHTVLEAALKRSPGSVLINSINNEYGGDKARKVLTYAADFGCPVIALTIDDLGMADTAERKFTVASELRKLACEEFGLPEHYIYIDPLVFTLATGEAKAANAALESLEALRRIKKEFPNIRTAMGVSNVSFGLKPKARRVLNNLMLHYAVEAGLDAAIFNPLHVDDVSKYDNDVRELADDLLLNRRSDALMRFVDYFEAMVPQQGRATEGGRPCGASSPESSPTFRSSQSSPADRLRSAVLNRDKRNLSDTINELLKTHPASDILNTILLPAMAEVGDRMAVGDMILPFVLQAAEVMKEAVTILEPHLKESGGGAAKGKMIIATVYGDVHDIGKNLVASILRNQGFEVIDLGKQVSVDTIVEAVRRESPDVVGLSALLVTTSQEMGKCVREFARQGIDVPVIIGGAAVNKEFAAKIAVLEDGSTYVGGVHYAKDAFGVVKVFDEIKLNSLYGDGGNACVSTSCVRNAPPKTDNAETHILKPKTLKSKQDADFDFDRSGALRGLCPRQRLGEAQPPYKDFDFNILTPPFHGTGEIITWSADNLLSSINNEHLFKAWWGGGNLGVEDYTRARMEEFEPVLERLSLEIIADLLVDARAFYGFFPVIADGENIIILDPSDNHTEVLSFVFPRMPKSGVSLADYIRPEGDVISVQAVTIGSGVGDRCRTLLTDQDRYSDGYYLNGLGNYLTETVADKASAEIRRALGLEKNIGRRYSFGYSGMPDLVEQARLIEYLGVEDRLGITLTEGFQMQPEHSTVAIFIHHPDAQYLS